jgi:hypothetical protein
MAEEKMGSRADVAGVPTQSAAALSPAMAGGWTITNDFVRTTNSWGPSGFAGAADDRY